MKKILKFKKSDVLHWYDYHDIVRAWRYLIISPNPDTFYIEEWNDDWTKSLKPNWTYSALTGELIEFLVEWSDELIPETPIYMEVVDEIACVLKISDETGREIIWKK